jgi:hypothetical protein
MTSIAVTALRVVVAVTGVRLLILAALPANLAADAAEVAPQSMRSWSHRHHAHRLSPWTLRTVAAMGRRASTVAWLRRTPSDHVVTSVLLAHRGRQQRRRMAAAFPACLDLLAAALEAGLPLEAAVSRCAGHGGALDSLLARIAARVRAGSPPAHAFEAEAAATGVPQLAAVSALLRRHHALGLELPAPLRQLADDARLQRQVALQERTARRAPMAALVTALLIAPSCLLALAVLLVGGLVASGRPW